MVAWPVHFGGSPENELNRLNVLNLWDTMILHGSFSSCFLSREDKRTKHNQSYSAPQVESPEVETAVCWLFSCMSIRTTGDGSYIYSSY